MGGVFFSVAKSVETETALARGHPDADAESIKSIWYFGNKCKKQVLKKLHLFFLKPTFLLINWEFTIKAKKERTNWDVSSSFSFVSLVATDQPKESVNSSSSVLLQKLDLTQQDLLKQSKAGRQRAVFFSLALR